MSWFSHSLRQPHNIFCPTFSKFNSANGLSILLFTATLANSQIKYDDGAIVTGQNFVTVRAWDHTNLTYFFQNGTNDIAGNDEQNAVRAAFQIWADYAPLTFTEVTNANSADIVILWGAGNHGDGFPFAGVNGVLAHAFFPPPNGNFAGDIHFDEDETWTMLERPDGFQPMDLVTVAAHEIGHALGLDHSNVNCALMNPFYNGSHRYLAPDDIAGIRFLYGTRQSILGTALVCNQETFSIRNVPTGGFVTWQSSNTSMATVNNQGVVTKVGNSSGSITLTSNLNLPCGLIVTENRTIAIGNPGAIGIVSYSNMTLCDGDAYFKVLSAIQPSVYNFSGNLTVGSTGVANSFTWSLPSGYSNNGWTWTGSGGTVTVSTKQSNTNLTLKATASNGCGSVSKNYSFRSGDCNISMVASPDVTISPNPTSGRLSVSTGDNNFAIRQVIVKTKMGIVVKTINYNGNKAMQNINIQDLAPDCYFIQIFDGKTWQTKKIIKE
jgi:predicted Zn-dependent protease